MKIKEEFDIIVEKYPYYEVLNEQLILDANCIEYPLSYRTNVKGKQSEWFLSSPSIEKVRKWIYSLILIEVPWVKPVIDLKWEINFRETWFAKYDIGDFAHIHDHSPYVFSFVYYVKCPKGSSPLIFTHSGKKVKAEEGKVVIFPGNIQHHVPNNKSNDRIVLAGNLSADSCLPLTHDTLKR